MSSIYNVHDLVQRLKKFKVRCDIWTYDLEFRMKQSVDLRSEYVYGFGLNWSVEFRIGSACVVNCNFTFRKNKSVVFDRRKSRLWKLRERERDEDNQ